MDKKKPQLDSDLTKVANGYLKHHESNQFIEDPIETYHRNLPDGFEEDGLVWFKGGGRYPGAWMTKEQYEQYKKLPK